MNSTACAVLYDDVPHTQTKFVGMMQYDGDLKLPTNFLVPPPAINHVSGQYLAANGISTFACSETQKVFPEPCIRTSLRARSGAETICLCPMLRPTPVAVALQALMQCIAFVKLSIVQLNVHNTHI